MKPYILVMALGGYMVLMGAVGYYRTGSPTALFINGSLGIITALFGYFMGRGNPMLANITIGWTALITIVLGFMTFKRINALVHGTPAYAGSEYIFGTQALFAIVVLIMLIRSRCSTGG